MDLKLLNTWDMMEVSQRRDALVALQKVCESLQDEAGVDIPPRELFCNGVYAREITIPKDTSLVGEIHLHDQINVVSQGKIRVATEEGVRTIEAPAMFISPAGTKRAGYALEETVWTVFHATEHTNTEDIRKDFIADDYVSLDRQLENRTNVMGSSSSGNDNSRFDTVPRTATKNSRKESKERRN